MAIARRRGVIPKPTGGVHTSDDIMALNRTQCQVIKNMHLDDHGVATTRHGSRLLNSTALDGAVTGIYDFRRPSGTGTVSVLLVKAGTILYSVNTSTGVATSLVDMNVTTRPTFATFQDSSSVTYAFIADGTNFIKYDGTSITNADALEDYPWASGAPRYIQVYDDRLMASGLDSDPYKVFLSGALDGTEWKPGAGDTAVFWTLKSLSGDRISAISTVYDYGVIMTRNQVDIITEANPSSDTSKQITVSKNKGTTSHWSVQNVGNLLYFTDDNHIYRGELRAAVENGLVVNYIDDSITEKYQALTNPLDVVSVYDEANKEIQWGIQTGSSARSDVTLVYNIGLSANNDGEHVWSGWFENTNYEPYTLAPVTLETSKYRANGTSYTDRKNLVFRGDKDGYVYIMDEADQWKDEVGGGSDADIVSEIHTAAFYPFGTMMTKRLRDVTVNLYSNYDESTTIQLKVDDRKRLPATARTINFRNIIPYWNDDTDSDVKQEWNTTMWMNKPMLAKPVAFTIPFQHFQVVIYNSGSNTKDEISYSGCEYTYQYHGVRRNF